MNIPPKLMRKMNKAAALAIQHRELTEKIDSEMDKLGIDVDRLRNDDACGYVDMIDYGTSDFFPEELDRYLKRED